MSDKMSAMTDNTFLMDIWLSIQLIVITHGVLISYKMTFKIRYIRLRAELSIAKAAPEMFTYSTVH